MNSQIQFTHYHFIITSLRSNSFPFTHNHHTTLHSLITPTPHSPLPGEAIGQYGMIKEGDKVMLGLSGGKDSLTMLHCLLALQRRSPVKFELACVTVDPQTTGFDPR